MISPSRSPSSDARAAAAAVTADLGAAPFARLRRGRVVVELAPFAVQTAEAARLLGIGDDLFRKIPFRVLPYARNGKHRWYLVHHVRLVAERLMALRIARGEPRHMESLLQLVHELPTINSPESPDGNHE
ncbi:hypothetical protein MASR1M101_41830 [Gemmatimonas sp.]